jgi:3-phenylpropionate/trans-cinnamate dioxygenase ferredoxin subunit
MANKYPVPDAFSLKPGQMKCFDVNGERVIVARVNDDFYAFEEMCSHEEFPLWYGALHGHRVECSLHGAQFDIRDGKPVFEPATRPIRTYPVTIANDQVIIEL